MNKTWILLRLYIKDLWGINKLRHSHDKKGKNRMILTLILAAVLTPLLIFYVTAYSLTLVSLGLSQYLLPLFALLAAILIVFTTFTKASSLLFGNNDYEVLAAMPIRSRELLTSRLIILYIHQLPFSLLIMLPPVVIYGIFMAPPILFYILALPLTVLLPLVPLVASSFLGAGITWLGARFRRKSFVTGILAALAMAAICLAPMLLSYNVGYMTSTGDMAGVSAMLAGLMDAILRIYPPAYWYAAGAEGNILSLVGFLLLNGGCFALFLVVLSRGSDGIRSALMKRQGNARQMQSSDFQVSSAFKALYKKELKRLFDSSIYLLNGATGGILAIVLAITLCFMDVGALFPSLGFIGDSGRLQASVVIGFYISFAVALITTTAATISLEGRNVWVLQTLPLPQRTIVNAKSAIDLTVKLPFVCIAALIISIRLSLGVFGFLIILAISAVYSVFSSQVGFFMDLRKPNYGWTNEAQVVKQGLSVLLTMLVGMIAIAVPIALFFVFSIDWIFLTAIGVLLLLLAASAWLHHKLIRSGI